jgi:hypothetical protein
MNINREKIRTEDCGWGEYRKIWTPKRRRVENYEYEGGGKGGHENREQYAK